MIAGDTSSVSAYFNGDTGSDVERIEIAFQNGELILPAAVLTELFSDPSLTPSYIRFSADLNSWKRNPDTGCARGIPDEDFYRLDYERS